MSLQNRILRALGTASVASVATQLVSFLRSLVLARILAPEDFGLFGMVTTATAGMLVFTNTGANKALIISEMKTEQDRADWASTVYWIGALKGLVLCAVCMATAPLFARFFEEPDVTGLIRIAAIGLVFQQIRSTGLLFLEKDLKLKRLVYWEVSKTFCAFAMAVTLSLVLDSALALALAFVLDELIGMILSFTIEPIKPRRAISRDVLQTVFKYTKSLLPVSVMTYITTQMDDAVVGHVNDADQLGYYIIAYRLSTLPVKTVTQILSKTLLPIYTNALHDDRETGIAIWKNSFEATIIMLTIIVIPLFYFSRETILFLYGEKWLPSAPLFAVLIWLGLFRGWTLISSSMILALKRPEIDARAKALETAVFVVLLLTLTPTYGPMGAVIAGLLNYMQAFFTRTIWILRTNRIGSWLLLKELARVVLTTLAVWPIHYVFKDHGIVSILGGALMGCAIAISNAYLKRKTIRSIRDEWAKRKRSNKKANE